MTAGRAVVVGSGMGGLTSAILLAKHGWRVTVLERHFRAGGYLHRFFRDGVGYDTGFHYVGGARPDQTFGRAMRDLGVADRVRFIPFDPDGFDILRFPGFDFRVPEGLDRWRDRLVDAFPHERAGLDRYVALHRAAIADYGWFSFDLSVPPEAILPWESRSLRSVMEECFHDPRLMAVIGGQAALYGVPAKEAPFGLHAIVTDHFLQGAWGIEGGGDKLALAMVKRLRELGGTLHLKADVAAIELAGGEARAVHLRDGRRFDADLVVANVHPRLVLDLLPAGAVRPAYAERVREAKPGRSHLGMYLRVDGDLSLLGPRNVYSFASWDVDDYARPSSPGDVPFYFASCPGQRGAHRLPGADEVVLGLIQVDWTTFRAWADSDPDARPAAYEALKAELLDSAIARIRADFPGWRVTWAEASTPLTTSRFTNAVEGASYGHYHSVAQMGRYRLPMWTRVRGLVQVGQCVAFPGICGAMMSAYVAMAEIVGKDRLLKELLAG
ncbi:MAG: phytoene desaturase family protein [Myxococcota bacterium]